MVEIQEQKYIVLEGHFAYNKHPDETFTVTNNFVYFSNEDIYCLREKFLENPKLVREIEQ